MLVRPNPSRPAQPANRAPRQHSPLATSPAQRQMRRTVPVPSQSNPALGRDDLLMLTATPRRSPSPVSTPTCPNPGRFILAGIAHMQASKRCAYCFVSGLAYHGHDFASCGEMSVLKDAFYDFTRTISFSAGHCYGCTLPQVRAQQTISSATFLINSSVACWPSRSIPLVGTARIVFPSRSCFSPRSSDQNCKKPSVRLSPRVRARTRPP